MFTQKSFKSYLHKVLKLSHHQINISKKATDCADAILRNVATKIATSSHLLTQGTGKKTLSSREVRAATQLVLPSELSTPALNFATQSVTMFNNAVKSSALAASTSSEKTKPQMRESRAGLVFSVSLCEKYIRNFGQIKYNIGSLASVVLAAVVQNVASQLVDLMAKQCELSQRRNITVRHIFMAIHTNSSLSEFVREQGIVLLGGNVVPNINDALLSKPKKPLRRKPESASADGTKRPHRWRPGTVAMRMIKQYQKQDGLLIQNAPFERIVRESVKQANTEANQLRYTREFMLTFQHVIENEVVQLLNGANRLAIHTGRETVQDTDVKLFAELSGRRSVVGTSELSVPTAAINKMGYRAGVKRLAQTAKLLCQQYIVNMVNHYMSYVVVCTQHNKRRTINTKFLLEGLRMCGISLAAIPEKRKLRKKASTEGTTNVESTVSALEKSASEKSVNEPKRKRAKSPASSTPPTLPVPSAPKKEVKQAPVVDKKAAKTDKGDKGTKSEKKGVESKKTARVVAVQQVAAAAVPKKRVRKAKVASLPSVSEEPELSDVETQESSRA